MVAAATLVMATGNGFLPAIVILVTIIKFADFVHNYLILLVSVPSPFIRAVGWGVNVLFCVQKTNSMQQSPP